MYVENPKQFNEAYRGTQRTKDRYHNMDGCTYFAVIRLVLSDRVTYLMYVAELHIRVCVAKFGIVLMMFPEFRA